MAALSSTLATKLANGKATVPSHGFAANAKLLTAQVAVTTSLAANDTLAFFTLPKGATVRHMQLQSTDIDTNASPTITFDVGDAGSATRFFSQSVVGQAGTSDSNMASTGWDYQCTADTPIIGTVHTAGATKAAGTVRLVCHYTVDGLAD